MGLKLHLATLKVPVPGTTVYVPVAFHSGSGLSIDRFKANSAETPLAVKGKEGERENLTYTHTYLR